jgi:hypothetical protein
VIPALSRVGGHLHAASSFHNKAASSIVESRREASITTNQKEHLRSLRARQYQLLSMHTTLASDVRDVLLEQQRLPIHNSRAVATVEEYTVNAKGEITSPVAEDGFSNEMSMLDATPRLEPLENDAKGVADADLDEYGLPLSSRLSDSSLGSLTGSVPSLSDSIRHQSLRRLQDFVMVTSEVASGNAGERKKKQVVFRYAHCTHILRLQYVMVRERSVVLSLLIVTCARCVPRYRATGKDGSLSITGGRHESAVANESRRSFFNRADSALHARKSMHSLRSCDSGSFEMVEEMEDDSDSDG